MLIKWTSTLESTSELFTFMTSSSSYHHRLVICSMKYQFILFVWNLLTWFLLNVLLILQQWKAIRPLFLITKNHYFFCHIGSFTLIIVTIKITPTHRDFFVVLSISAFPGLAELSKNKTIPTCVDQVCFLSILFLPSIIQLIWQRILHFSTNTTQWKCQKHVNFIFIGGNGEMKTVSQNYKKNLILSLLLSTFPVWKHAYLPNVTIFSAFSVPKWLKH